MTPTREQVIEMAEEAGAIQLHQDGWQTVIQGGIDDMQRFAVLAMEAGRLKGLEEAKVAPMREFCEWVKLPTNALDVMRELGNFGPTVNAKHREVKGYMLDDEGDGVSRYWTSGDLRNIANGCNDVADWLDQRAAIDQLKEQTP